MPLWPPMWTRRRPLPKMPTNQVWKIKLSRPIQYWKRTAMPRQLVTTTRLDLYVSFIIINSQLRLDWINFVFLFFRVNSFASISHPTLELLEQILSHICLKSPESHIVWNLKEIITFSTNCAHLPCQNCKVNISISFLFAPFNWLLNCQLF